MSDQHDKRVEIVSRKTLLKNFFHVEHLQLRHTLHNGGMSPAIDRLLLRRPDAVCAVVLHTTRQVLFFVNQFRAGVFEKDHGWLIELAAGLVDEGENAEEAIRREVSEELGFRPKQVRLLQKIHTSPAIITERIFLYYTEVDESMRTGEGGGHAGEHEDIEIIEVPVSQLEDFLMTHPITDAKTLIGIEQYLQMIKP